MSAFVDASGRPIPPMPRGTPKPNKLHLVAETTYFFRKSDGQFIAVDAATAWRIWSGQNQTIGRQPEPWQYVGRTDGKKYVAAVNKAYVLLEAGDENGFQEALKKAENEEYKSSRKDKTPPPNRDIINTSGLPNHEITG